MIERGGLFRSVPFYLYVIIFLYKTD